ncbi:MAG: hypothetical protein WA789_00075 [Candidatus Acidiferrum sp.]
MGNAKHLCQQLFSLFLGTLLLAVIVRAQDPSVQQDPPVQQNPPIQEDPQQAPKNAPAQIEGPTTPTPDPAVIAPTGPVDTQIHPAGKAVPWFGSASPLRWGPISIGNFTYQHVNDDFQPIGAQPAEDISLNILRTSLVLDQYLWGKQRLVLQWEPQLATLNGKIAGNAGFDNALMLGTTFQGSPRLTVTVKDAFADVHARELYPPGYLAVDEQAGNLIQNNFLQNAGSYLSNEVSVIVGYLISPQTTLTISPDYKYIHAADNQEVLYLASGNVIANTVALTHALTERQSIGVLYTLEMLRQNDDAGVPGNSFFHTVGLYYANRLSATWWVRGEFGLIAARYPADIPPTNTIAGTFSIVKTFTTGSFSIGYTRGRVDNNFLTAQIGDLVQAAYSQHLTKRLAWNSGLGYYRETGADPRNMGNTAGTGLEFEMLKNVFVDASYAHLFQKSSTPQLLSGTRNTVILGIKWEPRGPLLAH